MSFVLILVILIDGKMLFMVSVMYHACKEKCLLIATINASEDYMGTIG